MRKIPRLAPLLSIGAALALGAGQARAGSFSSDFNAGLPGGANAYGNVFDYDLTTGGVDNSGCLKLTTAINSQQGAFIIDDLDGGGLVGGFDVSWKMLVGGGSGTPADGFSFVFGTYGDAAFSEEGPDTISGLTISFDIYDNGGGEAPAIDLKWDGTTVAHKVFPIATLRSGSAFWDVNVHVDPDGTLDLTYNGQAIYSNIPIYRPLAGARFGFGARTGGLNDNMWLDDLSITTTVPTGPYIRTLQPTGAGASAEGIVFVELVDAVTQVNPNSIQLTFNGAAVTPTVSKNADTTSVSYNAPGLLAVGSTNNVVLSYADNSTPPKTNSVPFSFVVGAYGTVSTNFAVTSVDTTKPGFKVKVYQTDIARGTGDGNLLPAAERQFSRGLVNPDVGQPYENLADLTLADTNGVFIDENVINWNQDAPGLIGNFNSGSVPPMEDELVPGIPGVLGSTDNYVAEITGYLELKAGGYRFGVNSDDGFRFSLGRAPGDIMGTTMGSFSGGRGSADTTFDVVIPADGYYPMRLLWWEGGGGSNVELFMTDLGTGQKVLINDLTAAAPIKAYREATVTRPYVSRALPSEGYNYVFADEDVLVEITDGSIPVNAGSVSLTVNGQAVSGATKNGTVTTVKRTGSIASPLASGANSATLVYSYTEAGNTVNVTNTWSFNVPAYAVLPAGNKVPVSSVSGTGFNVRVNQMDRSSDGNQGDGGRFPGDGNRMPRPEVQLAGGFINPADGLPYPNIATPGPNADGSYDIPDIINFNSPAGNSGIFNGDFDLPGLPGTGTSNAGNDNYVAEITTYLDLKAGAYLFGVNSDDGFLVTSAPNAHDTLGTVLGSFNGGRGNAGSLPVESSFGVIVPEDGIYPFRLLYWQGGGGVNVEFLSVNKQSGQSALVNDFSVYPWAIPAYSTYTGTARPWVKFSVSPTPWDNRTQQSGPGPILLTGRTASSTTATDIYNSADNTRTFADTGIGAVIANLGNGTVSMLLNGAPVTPTTTTSGTDTTVVYRPNPPLASGSTNTASLIYAGVTNSWTFVVQSYVTVPESLALPVSAADTSAPGFTARVVQAPTGAAIANSLARAESQLAGTLTDGGNPIANVATPGSGPNGTYIITNIINWNQELASVGNQVQIGNFQSPGFGDTPIPGVPGSEPNNQDNIAAEVLTYLQFDAPGYYKLGVNSDDGFRVTAATSNNTNAPVLGLIDAGKGSSDVPFSFNITKAGLYPVRLVWFEGGGGANLEFYSYGPNNQKIAINDRSNANGIKAYYRVNGGGTAPTLSINQVANGSVRLTFTGTLQSTATLTPPNWQNVTGAASPMEVAPADAQRYWRAVNP